VQDEEHKMVILPHLLSCFCAWTDRLSWSGEVTKGSDDQYCDCCTAAGTELFNRRQAAWVSMHMWFFCLLLWSSEDFWFMSVNQFLCLHQPTVSAHYVFRLFVQLFSNNSSKTNFLQGDSDKKATVKLHHVTSKAHF